MTPEPRPLRLLLILALTWACTPHRPWDRSVPAAARTRWRLGQGIFSSVAGDVKLMNPDALTQEPSVRRAAEAALLSITAHARLPEDPARTRRLLDQLEKAGFSFAAARLRNPVKVAPPDERFRLATRDWSGLDLPLTSFRVAKTGAPILRRLVRTHLHDPSGAVAIWALELARRGEGSGDGLDCAAWQTIAQAGVQTHSERVLTELWPAVLAACTEDELEAWTVAQDGRIPELTRLFGATAGFDRLVRVCVSTGARFPAVVLRAAFDQLREPGPSELALGLLCSDAGFLTVSLTNPVLEAARLRLTGRAEEAMAMLVDRAPAPDSGARLRAGRLALVFGDRTAAAGHFRWAAAMAEEPGRRRDAYAFLRLAARLTAEEEWTALVEQFRLDPAGTARELWLSGQWPALVLLAGRAPVPRSAAAGRALADYAACHPAGGALAPKWRALMGEENLRKVWPAPDPTRPCRRPASPRALPSSSGAGEPAWQGDLHSDLSILLHQARPPADWEAFLARHAGHPQVTAVAELARDLYPDSPGHLEAAAAAFLRRNDPDRAAGLLRAALALHPDRVAALAGQAELLLRSGYRHEAAALWRERLAWQTAFASSEERDREDWRVEPRLELVDFLWRAGFPEEGRSQLDRLLEDARKGDSLRRSRVAALAADRFPALVAPEQVLRITASPLTLLRLAVGRPGWERPRDHVLTQLALLLPEAPEVAWLSCVWRNRQDACLDALALGVDPPGQVRLPVLLPLLDRLLGLDTTDHPASLRLALQVARWRARVVSEDWRFVEEALLRE